MIRRTCSLCASRQQDRRDEETAVVAGSHPAAGSGYALKCSRASAVHLTVALDYVQHAPIRTVVCSGRKLHAIGVAHAMMIHRH